MKKILLLSILIIQALSLYSQSPEAEKHAVDSLLRSGKLNSDQSVQLWKRWNAFIAKYKYPELHINNSTGEFDFSDRLTFVDLDKKVIFQRCLQWIAINYGNLTYQDLESGKIIANGQIDLTHFADYPAGFGSKESRQVQTSTNYTLILTLKDNKIKYNITNITFNFNNYSETIDEISYPINTLFPIIAHDQIQWLRFVTVLNASIDKFNVQLKKSLADYVNDFDNDYRF